MEFLVVSDSKLKIMMNRDEMKKYNIDGEDIDYDDPRTRRSFWRILDVAREKCGFEASGDKVLIQFYPSKDGSEIFVTKLGIISSVAERSIMKSSKVAMLEARIAIYRFESKDALLGVIKCNGLCENKNATRAFVDSRGIYYMITEERTGSRRGELREISEFGTELPANLSGYIAEHAEEIRLSQLDS